MNTFVSEMSQLSMIDKLGNVNFDSWKLQIEAVELRVTGTSVRSEAGSTDEKTWIQKDQKARADIILAINPSELYHVKHCTTSKDVWNKLKEVYESKGHLIENFIVQENERK